MDAMTLKAIARHHMIDRIQAIKNLERIKAEGKIIQKHIDERRAEAKINEQHRTDLTRATISMEARNAYAKWQQEREIEYSQKQQAENYAD